MAATTKEQDAKADAPKMTTKDRETRLLDLKRRNKDVHKNHPNEIERGEFLHFSASVFKDEKFLLDEIDRLRKLLGRRATEPEEEPAKPGDD